MTERYKLMNGLEDEGPFEWDIIDTEKDAIIEQGNGVAITKVLNEQDKKIKEYQILVKSLKDQNQKLKLRLEDLGVEYYD